MSFSWNVQTTDDGYLNMAIHSVVCQKSDFHGNSDFRNFQKARPFTNTSKKVLAKYVSL
jgi:exo-beta-1,3-glucanase (GH17 family)